MHTHTYIHSALGKCTILVWITHAVFIKILFRPISLLQCFFFRNAEEVKVGEEGGVEANLEVTKAKETVENSEENDVDSTNLITESSTALNKTAAAREMDDYQNEKDEG